MPRKIRPRTEWRPKDIRDAPSIVLTDEQKQAILDPLPALRGTDVASRDNAFAAIEECLRLYYLHRTNLQGAPKPREISAALGQVQEAAGALEAAINALDPISLQHLVNVAGWDEFHTDKSPLNETPFPDVDTRGRQRLALLSEAARQCQGWAEKVRVELAPGKSGPTSNTALNRLAKQLARIYAAHASVRPKHSYKSSWAPFLKAVIETIQPSPGPGQLEVANRLAVGELRQNLIK